MGNNASHLDLDQVMHELDKLALLKANRVEKTPSGTSAYRVVIPVGDGEDIIKNLTVPDAKYRSVVLTVGTQVFDGQLQANTWHFPTAIPLFKIPDDTCQLTIYSLGDSCQQPVELCYDSYKGMPTDIKTRCNAQALVSGGVMYNNGFVY